jgi:prepilin-type N-terminal cleavage/methylation domain-containing protein
MITTTPLPVLNRPGRIGSARAGFTLVEVMISAFIGAWILAAVLSTFLFMGRSGANIQNYNDMEQQSRRALEYFAEDTRQASGVVWTTDTTLKLTVATNTITYTYDSTAGTLTRTVVVTATSATTYNRVLITGITAGKFSFTAYNIAGNSVAIDTTANRLTANGTTKQIQLSLECARTNTTVVAATNSVLSARFILRNKKVTA